MNITQHATSKARAVKLHVLLRFSALLTAAWKSQRSVSSLSLFRWIVKHFAPPCERTAASAAPQFRHKMASLTATLRQHADEVCCCAFSPTLLATSSGDKTIRVYSTGDFSELPYSPLSGHGYGVHCCRFSSCGSYLVSCSTDGTVMAWSSATGEVTAALLHPERSPLRVCALAPDSSLLLAGACDGSVALWDFTSKTLRRYGSGSV